MRPSTNRTRSTIKIVPTKPPPIYISNSFQVECTQKSNPPPDRIVPLCRSIVSPGGAQNGGARRSTVQRRFRSGKGLRQSWEPLFSAVATEGMGSRLASGVVTRHGDDVCIVLTTCRPIHSEGDCERKRCAPGRVSHLHSVLGSLSRPQSSTSGTSSSATSAKAFRTSISSWVSPLRSSAE